jgi:transketolase
MRTAFFRALMDIAALDHRITLIVGDLGFGVVEPFVRQFPDQFLNAGVAEQNLTGIAAGMALMGRIVVTYSIANFPTLRCLEQIRNDVCYHRADVKIVALGGGFAYGALGVTHHATEDLAVMRSLPEMTVVAPGDPVEADLATRAIIARPGPCYLRLGRAGEPVVHHPGVAFDIGKAIRVRDGNDLTIIATGGMLPTAVTVAGDLAVRGISSRVLSMHTVKPIDEDAIVAAACETGAVFTLEEHSLIGGLGSAVAEVLAEMEGTRVRFKRIGLPREFAPVAGSQEYMRMAHGLGVQSVIQSVINLLEIARAN